MYGTLQGPSNDESPCVGYGRPWWLFWEASSGLLLQGIALVLVWWHHQRNPLEEAGCGREKYEWFCESSQAHIVGFPLLAAAVCVVLALRQLLRKRIYYGLLGKGVMIDFRTVEQQVDPVLIYLTWCLLCAILHEAAFYSPRYKPDDDKLKIGVKDIFKVEMGADDGKKNWLDVEMSDSAQQFLFSYCAPCIVYLVFLYQNYNIEPWLLPLNSYYVANPEEAKRSLSDAVVVDELEVAAASAEALAAGQEPPTDIDGAYDAIVLRREAMSSTNPPVASMFRLGSHGLLAYPWPASVLLDSNLSDDESVSFSRMWYVLSLTCGVFLMALCAELALITTSAWQATFSPSFNGGLATAAATLSIHFLLIARMLLVVVCPKGICGCCR